MRGDGGGGGGGGSGVWGGGHVPAMLHKRCHMVNFKFTGCV